MLSDASDVLALEDELRACEKRRCDFSEMLRLANEYHLNERYPDLGSHLLSEVEMASRRYHALIMSAAKPPRKRGRSYGEQDETLHEIRAQVIAEIRRRKKSTRLSWPKIVRALRGNSAYSARMRGKTDATWIRYAKSGFSG